MTCTTWRGSSAAYKKAIETAEPIGAFVNDNICVTTAAFVKESHAQAVRSAVGARTNYLQSQVFRYHDTFPHPEGVPYWPEVLPAYDAGTIEAMASIGAVICGDPGEALEQCRRWESAGTDQLVLSAGTAPVEDTIETIELLGAHVIPKIDTDPVHRTSQMRAAATTA